MADPRPIGVFDSGVGGLTVARALMDLLPDERVIYLGDTARGPYGPRTVEEVRAFTADDVGWLAEQDVKFVIAACNTATAAALELDPLTFDLPVLGVIEPAVETAIRVTRSRRIGVIGTQVTISSGAYDRAVERLGSVDTKLTSAACPRFVTLVEQGRTTDPEVLEVAEEYLAPMKAAQVDTLILGCTHYPLLTGVISYVMGPDVTLVSSAETCARAVFAHLVDADLLAHTQTPQHRFAATGDPADFARLAERFLGPRIRDADVEPA
ncbi:MAG: glutamate racemase [Actinomycetota bacterium]|uniref:glutamate racemase n=1 Tax=Euzebya rosea TaxID=2052804 RepID=UPI000D3E235F|nr:glutamate racemase [Euzebya rosea]